MPTLQHIPVWVFALLSGISALYGSVSGVLNGRAMRLLQLRTRQFL